MSPKAERTPPPMPEAKVERGGDRTHVLRGGRGFSRGELSEAGIPVPEARLRGLRVDLRRRSKREGNVASLKHWAKRIRKPPKPLAAKKKRKKRRAPARKEPGEGAVSQSPVRRKRRKRKAERKRT